MSPKVEEHSNKLGIIIIIVLLSCFLARFINFDKLSFITFWISGDFISLMVWATYHLMNAYYALEQHWCWTDWTFIQLQLNTNDKLLMGTVKRVLQNKSFRNNFKHLVLTYTKMKNHSKGKIKTEGLRDN